MGDSSLAPEGRRGSALFPPLATLLMLAGGCQLATPPPRAAIRAAAAVADLSGLNTTQTVAPVRITAAPPENWLPLPLHRSDLYTHQQWRSPSRCTGLGVAYIRLPLPVGADMLLWLAKLEYRKRQKDNGGEVIAEWKDAQGRPWFEARDQRYQVRGFAITRGLDAWIVYSGHKLTQDPRRDELELAMRSLQTVCPTN